MLKLYPSWIEIPVSDLERATAFYRAVINFHVDTHAALTTAIEQVQTFGGKLDKAVVDMGDGVHYINLLD